MRSSFTFFTQVLSNLIFYVKYRFYLSSSNFVIVFRGAMPLLDLAKFNGLRFSLAALQPIRSVATVTPDNKGRRTVRAVTSRYQRTGAGIWFRNLAGRSNRQLEKFSKRYLNEFLSK